MAEQPVDAPIRGDLSSFQDNFVYENRLALAFLGIHFLICAIVATATDTWLLLLVAGVPALLLPAWLVRHYPTAFLSRLAVSSGAMIFTLLGVQQTGGYMEAHFSFFVMITMLAVYRDWRLLIFASALIIAHHIGFTVFNPLALGFYERNDGLGAWRHVFFHLTVGLIQVFTLCYLTILLRRREKQNAALGSSLDRANELAIRDPLTGLFNRNHLANVVAQLSSRARDGSMQTVLCLLDLDHFKAVNDSFGHAAGDDVLRAVSETIKEQVRSGDCAFRQGGEEFLVLLPHSTIQDGLHFAERVRTHVASHLVSADGARIGATISIGLAAWQEGQTFHDTFERADEALYAAKTGGRNRVEIWSDGNQIQSHDPIQAEQDKLELI